jgi:spore coat polysaccharide biosynthesis protein SpsF
LIRHVLAAIERALPLVPVVVATSRESSDDPLVSYLRASNIDVFRGPLDNVFERFRMCLAEHVCDWILRFSADSPLLDSGLLQEVVSREDKTNCDLVTTIFPRTFPRGRNAELIQVSTFMTIDTSELSEADREHVTQVYYRNPERFRIVNIQSGNPQLAELSLAVDTVEDLHRLEQLSEVELRRFSYDALTWSSR